MKITIVCDVLGKENNGTTIAAMNLIRSLKEKGHEVKVVCNDKDKKNLEGYYVVPELNLLFLNPTFLYLIHIILFGRKNNCIFAYYIFYNR